jgi:hypothetical protein
MKDLPETPKFRYYTGEIVMEGDHVISENGKPGIVEKIIAPGTSDSTDFACPDGGLLIKEDWEGTPSYLVVTPPDGISWEDMEFVCRGTPVE